MEPQHPRFCCDGFPGQRTASLILGRLAHHNFGDVACDELEWLFSRAHATKILGIPQRQTDPADHLHSQRRWAIGDAYECTVGKPRQARRTRGELLLL